MNNLLQTREMGPQSLGARLQALADTYRATLNLIHQLQKLPFDANSTDTSPQADLASEIHESLKEQEDTLELLRQEADESHYSTTNSRWVGGGSVRRRRDSERESEHERNAATIARLSEDLKSARGAFRRAQLQASRNAKGARQRDRELLFANRGGDPELSVPGRRKGMEKLTQEELALNASSDVTAALRRTHDLMQGNLQQSQFAQQTLDESSAALASLGESYGGVGDLLKGSKGLVGQLLKSQKSDTWYLETAFMILAVTISWLVFRRLLYGPLWWFVWQPLKGLWWLATVALNLIGLAGAVKPSSVAVSSSVANSPGLNANGVPTLVQGMPPRSMYVGGKGGGWDGPSEPPRDDDSMVEKIGIMAEKIQDGMDHAGIEPDDISDEEASRQEEQPRNTKKRMWEEEVRRDEL
jgi:protein transport protein SEC20